MVPSSYWSSAFRPFYLLGSAYAPLLAAIWLAAWLGLLPTPGGIRGYGPVKERSFAAVKAKRGELMAVFDREDVSTPLAT